MGYPYRRKASKFLKAKDRPENFQLEQTKSGRNYNEDKEQKAFITTLKDLHDRGLFKTIPDLEMIRFSSMPEFGYEDGNELNNIIKGKRNKAKGYLKGWFDITVVWKFKGCRPNFGFIEMKCKDGVISEAQEKLNLEFGTFGINKCIAYSAVEALAAMKRWNLLPPAYAAMIT